MKKLSFLLLFLAATTLSFSQIANSGHDFSGDAWNASGEICIVCHTPHNADMTVATAPLWNHEVTVFTPYVLYSSSTLNATVGQPGDESKLCLSCHDGTVALENFGGVTGSTNNYVTGTALVGTDISDDHPISFTYDAALATADGGLYDPTTANSGLGGTITVDMLFSGRLECASCHDVHDDALGMFLRIDNAASALCLTCHDK